MASTRRAPRSQGQRTTLRIPGTLAATVDQLASELDISKNDALLRLAARGAHAYEREKRIDDLREERWRAVVAGMGDVDPDQLPSAEEMQAAVLAARDDPSLRD